MALIVSNKGGQMTRPDPIWKFRFESNLDEGCNLIGFDFGQPDEIGSWSDRVKQKIQRNQSQNKHKSSIRSNPVWTYSNGIGLDHMFGLSLGYIFSNPTNLKSDWVDSNPNLPTPSGKGAIDSNTNVVIFQIYLKPNHTATECRNNLTEILFHFIHF